MLNASADHLLLILRELLVWHGGLLAGLRCADLALVAILLVNVVVGAEIIFLEVLSVAEGRSTVKISLESAFHIWQLAFHRRVPVILDGVVCAAFQHLCDLGPLVVHNAVHEEKDPLLFFAPVDFLDSRVQMIVPPFSALFADSAVQVLRDEGPLLGTICHDKLQHAPVLFCGPRALHVEWLAFSSESLLG